MTQQEGQGAASARETRTNAHYIGELQKTQIEAHRLYQEAQYNYTAKLLNHQVELRRRAHEDYNNYLLAIQEALGQPDASSRIGEAYRKHWYLAQDRRRDAQEQCIDAYRDYLSDLRKADESIRECWGSPAGVVAD